MEVSVTEAKARLTQLIRRVEAGEDVVLTRNGAAVVRLSAIARPRGESRRRAIVEAVMAMAPAGDTSETAARSQDLLYDEDGLPA